MPQIFRFGDYWIYFLNNEKDCPKVSDSLMECRTPHFAGFPAAHPAIRLVLLPSGPDTIHGATLHGTRRTGNSALRPSAANC